jgi:hypothetical protein
MENRAVFRSKESTSQGAEEREDGVHVGCKEGKVPGETRSSIVCGSLGGDAKSNHVGDAKSSPCGNDTKSSSCGTTRSLVHVGGVKSSS